MLSFLFIVIAGICKAVSDTLAHHYADSVFTDTTSSKLLNNSFFSFINRKLFPTTHHISWWDNRDSHQRKWKNGVKANGEEFKFSSTALVRLTDGWHFFNSLQIMFVMLAIVSYNSPAHLIENVVAFCAYYAAFTLNFEFFYSRVLVRS
jgi:hypothetical protein